MTTSGTYTLTYTASQMVMAAMRVLGVVDPDEAPSSNEKSNAIEALNHILLQAKGPNNRMFKGVRVWQTEVASLTLEATRNTYLLKPGGQASIQIPEEIKTVFLRHTSTTTDTNLEPIGYDEYYNIPNKLQQSMPTRWYYERTNSTGTLYLDCKPSTSVAAAYCGAVVYRQPLEIVSVGSNEIDIPGYYYRPIKFILARDIAPEFPEVSMETFNKVERLAQEALNVANSFEPEDAPEDAFFQPGCDY